MYKLTEIVAADMPCDDQLTLAYDARQKFRLLARTDKGLEVGIQLPRGYAIRPGSVLTGDHAMKFRVRAAEEQLSVVHCSDPLLFARACYHLGNRHVALQILPGELRYLSDHVLDRMLLGMGLKIEQMTMAFEPEAGAYQQHGH